MKHMVIVAAAAAMLLAGIDVAAAKSYRSHSSGGGHSGGSMRVHAPRAPKAHAARAKGDYVIVKCKTAACLKKHPSGTYGFYPKQKKS